MMISEVSSQFTDEERNYIAVMKRDLALYSTKNDNKWAYYDGSIGVKNIGIAVPESLNDVEAVIGWGEIVVDALDERLDWQGWSLESPEAELLQSVFRENQMGTEFDKTKLDALVTGVGFLEVTAGGPGERDVIVNAVSPSQGVYLWDNRASRVAAGLVMKSDADGNEYTTLYLPNETVASVTYADGSPEVFTRTIHNRNRCGLIAFPNRSRSGETRGKSELSKPIRYTIDHGIRTILGMEYNREIYTTPQRWFSNMEPEQLGVDEEISPAQRVKVGWDVAMNRVVIMPPNPEGEGQPQTGQYQSAPPTPYVEELRMCSQLIAAYSGVQPSQLGFVTDNPPSADSIRAMESRHVKKAERRITSFNHILINDLAYVILCILHEKHPEEVPFPTSDVLTRVSTKWNDPSTPTLAAATDSVVKLIEAGVVPPTSSVVLERAGFSDSEIARIQQDRQAGLRSALVQSITARANQPTDPVVERLVQQNEGPTPPSGPADQEETTLGGDVADG